jgi:hypothetical protein
MHLPTVPHSTDQFPAGTQVRVKPRLHLKRFQRPEWKYHHPISDEQLDFAGVTDTVKAAGFAHGVFLYTLIQTPGIWHEDCLEYAT